MVTFAQAAATIGTEWCPIITIESSGQPSSGTIYKYCARVPAYAAGSSLYRPWLAEWPRSLTERLNLESGLPESGEISFRLQDVDGALTEELRICGDPQCLLSAAITSGATSVTLSRTTGIVAGSTILYVGSECMRVVSGSNPYTVTRAVFDSLAQSHAADEPVYIRSPFVDGRTIRLYLAPYDGDSASTETLFGTFRLDSFDPTEDFTQYAITGRSAQSWNGRAVNRAKPYEFTVSVDSGENITVFHSDANALTPPLWPGKGAYVEIDGEILRYTSYPTGGASGGVLGERALFGTRRHAAGDLTDKRGKIVFAADDDRANRLDGLEPTFFRFSPGPSPSSSRSSGTWTRSAHAIDIILNLITSSAETADGLELANRNATYGAWDCLPVGVGIGVPHAEVDIPGMLALLQAEPQAQFPEFVVPSDGMTFADLLSQYFLKPLGWYLTTSSGQAKILPLRPPIAGETGATIGPSEILSREVGRLQYEDTTRAGYRLSTLRTVTAKFRDHTFIVKNSDLGTNFGAQHYRSDDAPFEFEVKSSAQTEGGTYELPAWAMRAIQIRFALSRKPQQRTTFSTSIAQYTALAGSTLSLTHERIPDPINGVIGVVAALSLALERRLRIQPGTMSSVWFDWTALTFPGVRLGRIAPSARIVSCADVAGTPDVTVSTNRYSKADAQGIVADAAGFAVNDIITIKNRDGTQNSASTATITGIAGDIITLNTNPGGQLNTGASNQGQIIEYAPRATAAAQQYNGFVYFADKVDLTVGASAQSPWKYA